MGVKNVRLEIIYIILGMAIVTFLTRFGSLILLRYTGIPSSFTRWLKYMPIGILASLIIPSLLVQGGHLAVSVSNPYLIAGMVTAVAVFKSGNAILSMTLGMTVMVILRQVN